MHDDARRRRRLTRTTDPRVVVFALSLAGLTSAFMQTIIVPIQARLPELLDAPREDTAWVVTITLLTSAVVTPIAGRLGDMVGKRRIALVLLALMTLGSLVAAFAPGIVGLIIGRGLQGAGMGVIPLGISIMRDVLPEKRLPGGIALMSATLGIGGAIGMPLSAVISQYLDWHLLFWIAAGLSALCLTLVVAFVPASVLRTPGRFDWLGSIGLATALVGLLLALSRGGAWGWTSPLTLGLGLGGLAVLAGWGWYELRDGNPLVDLRVAARAPVLLTNLSSLFLSFGLFAFNVGVPQYLEQSTATGGQIGLSLTMTGLVLLPSGLMMLVIAPISGRLIRLLGPKPLLIAGGAIVGVAYVICLIDLTNVWQALVVNVVFGIGIGLAFAAAPTLIMRAVPATETAAANGLNALLRSVGTTAAAAAVGALLAAMTVEYGAVVVPTQDAFRWAFVLGLAAAVLSAGIAAFIPRHVPRPVGERPALPE
ncbi:MAG TPA: MFS transporter [Microbacteriaceae bacterium]|nr:MFS transporter [Microbacteriaceae bacterium]